MKKKYFINIMKTIYILILLIVVAFLFTINIPCGCNSESFYNGPGTGKSFGFYNHPRPKCLAENNCFRGSYVQY